MGGKAEKPAWEGRGQPSSFAPHLTCHSPSEVHPVLVSTIQEATGHLSRTFAAASCVGWSPAVRPAVTCPQATGVSLATHPCSKCLGGAHCPQPVGFHSQI